MTLFEYGEIEGPAEGTTEEERQAFLLSEKIWGPSSGLGDTIVFGPGEWVFIPPSSTFSIAACAGGGGGGSGSSRDDFGRGGGGGGGGEMLEAGMFRLIPGASLFIRVGRGGVGGSGGTDDYGKKGEPGEETYISGLKPEPRPEEGSGFLRLQGGDGGGGGGAANRVGGPGGDPGSLRATAATGDTKGANSLGRAIDMLKAEPPALPLRRAVAAAAAELATVPAGRAGTVRAVPDLGVGWALVAVEAGVTRMWRRRAEGEEETASSSFACGSPEAARGGVRQPEPPLS